MFNSEVIKQLEHLSQLPHKIGKTSTLVFIAYIYNL